MNGLLPSALLPSMVLAFAGLAAGAVSLADGADPSATATAFDFDSPHGLVIVEGRIDDRSEVRLLIDTGDPAGLTLDHDMAQTMGLNLNGGESFRAHGVAGSSPAVQPRTRVEVLDLGGIRLRDLDVLALPSDTRFEKAVGVDLDGSIGLDLLRDMVVTIDYPERRISLAPPVPARSEGPATRRGAPLHLRGGRLWVDVVVNGRETRSMILDTGSAATLIAPAARSLVRPASGGGMRIVDLTGAIATLPARVLPSLGFGGVVVEQVPVALYDFEPLLPAHLTGDTFLGLIGADLLSRHVVVLDLPGGWLRVERAAP